MTARCWLIRLTRADGHVRRPLQAPNGEPGAAAARGTLQPSPVAAGVTGSPPTTPPKRSQPGTQKLHTVKLASDYHLRHWRPSMACPTTTARTKQTNIKQAVRRLRDAGRTIRDIAARLGRCRSTIGAWAVQDATSTTIRNLKERVMELENELAFIKKSAPILSLRTKQRYAYIRAEAESYAIAFMCRCLEVSRSGYYNWVARGLSERERRNARLATEIMRIYEASRGL